MESSISKTECEIINPTTIGLALAKEYGYTVSAANTVLSPGKFEGEHVSTLYFWDCYMNGFGDLVDDDLIVFDLSESEREHLDLPCNEYRMRVSDNGFVYGNV